MTWISCYFPLVIFVFSLWVHQNVFTAVTNLFQMTYIQQTLLTHKHDCSWSSVKTCMLVLLIFRLGDLRWSSHTLWRLWRSDCRWQEKSPQGHASALSLSSVTWVSLVCTRYVTFTQNNLKPNSHNKVLKVQVCTSLVYTSAYVIKQYKSIGKYYPI